jgi:hypothetical protein
MYVHSNGGGLHYKRNICTQKNECALCNNRNKKATLSLLFRVKIGEGDELIHTNLIKTAAAVRHIITQGAGRFINTSSLLNYFAFMRL